MNEFHEETNESHDAETNGGGNGDLLEFSSIWFCATLNQSNGVLGEGAARFTVFDNFIHFVYLKGNREVG